MMSMYVFLIIVIILLLFILTIYPYVALYSMVKNIEKIQTRLYSIEQWIKG